jgi:large subunit ribosomal protein L4
LSDKVANESLIVVDNLSLEYPRTKDMLEILSKLPTSAEKRVLMMLPRRDENVVLSARNIPSAKVQHVSSINVVELLKHDYVIMPVETVRWLEMVFGEGLSAEEATLRIAEGISEVDEIEESSESDEVDEIEESSEASEVDETEESSEATEVTEPTDEEA